MAFSRKPAQSFPVRLTTPTGDTFEAVPKRYMENLLKEIEGVFARLYGESRRVYAVDDNPARNIHLLDGKSGSISVDLGVSQYAHGTPVFIIANSLGGALTITSIDNAYQWTLVYIINLDASNDITISNGANILTETGANLTVSQNDIVSFTQVNNTPLWLQASTLVTND